MKVTKAQIKNLLIEELEQADSALLAAINNLIEKIEDLDVSIDYLAAASTGDSAAAIGYAQGALGRFGKNKVDEAEQYVKSFYTSKEERAEDLKDKGVDSDIAYGIADKQMDKDGKKKKK
jgi:phospholipase/lecithinase/hemolysin